MASTPPGPDLFYGVRWPNGAVEPVDSLHRAAQIVRLYARPGAGDAGPVVVCCTATYTEWQPAGASNRSGGAS